MNLNVLKDYLFPRRYYLLHPWKFFHEVKTNLKNARMRVKKGYCWTDVWNIDDWFLTVFPEMLRALAQKCCGHPGFEPFETPEKWMAWLNDMAGRLESCREENYEKLNEYYDDYMKQFDNWQLNQPSTEIDKKYFARERELAEEAQNRLEDTMAEIMKNLHLLWD